VGDTIDELASLFSSYDTVIGCAGYAAGINTLIKLAKAALQSGILRYFPCQFGVDFGAIGRGGPRDILNAQFDVRELLRSQDKTEWVIISAGMFMSYLLEPALVSSIWRIAKLMRSAALIPLTLNKTEKMGRRLSLSDVTVKDAYRLTRVLSYG
jgi:hypothetical protein